MAKTKNKKHVSSEKVHKKDSKAAKKPMNPFEVHINKEKIKVLGRKLKNDRGLPGVSRAKALKKRKNTLLQEYKVQNKSNKFTDRRIGEKNVTLSEEDRVMARFTAERVKAHKKRSIFNLADDETLTHKGQTLSEIEKFVDERSDDEDSLDGNQSGKLESSFVGDAHFGGGILKKTGKEGARTHRELIDQLIAESKKRKAEKQKIKEATLELTEKLDTEWKDLLPLVNTSKKSVEEATQKSKLDDYDKVMHELKFEARGTPSDRLKTEDEIAKEEKEKLEDLEKQRLERMKGFLEKESVKPVHRSADDLDDDFIYESDPEYMLSYNDVGESNVKVDADINGKLINLETEDKEGESDVNSNEGSHSEELESETEDDLSDLKNNSNSDDSDNEEKVEEEELTIHSKVITFRDVQDQHSENKKPKLHREIETVTNECHNKIKADLLERKNVMERARNELPFTFSVPDSYESFQSVFESQPPSHQNIILERMIKCNHPSLGENNKSHLSMVFIYLLQHLSDVSADASDKHSIRICFEIFKELVPHLFDLAQLNKENAHASVVEVIKERHSDYQRKCKTYPNLDVLIFLKLVSCLFPTSDFRHQIVTPCFIFMEQMLNKCKVVCRRDVAYGLFLATLLLEYTSLSRRFLPAAINFLTGILHLTIPKAGVKLVKVLPPFKSTSSLLLLLNDCSHESLSLKLDSIDLLNDPIEDSFKIRSTYTALKLLSEYHQVLSHLPSVPELFEPAVEYLKLIPRNNYPKEVQAEFEKLLNGLSSFNRVMEFIVMEKKRPKALKLYEPKIEIIYDVKRHKSQSKEKAERDKLLYKIKKERKGAMREIRRDQAYLGRIKIKQKIQSDVERKEKVKQIFADAAMQQSELNAMDRKKKRK